MRRLLDLPAVQCVDFEYFAPPRAKGRLRPICMSAVEFQSRRPISLWLWDDPPAASPFGGDWTLFAYAAQAEVSCFIELGWRLPPFVIDAFAEFRVHTNGLRMPGTNGLLGALDHYGIRTSTDQARKDEMRDLCIAGGPFSAEQKAEIMAYCNEDARALADLLAALEADDRGGSND